MPGTVVPIGSKKQNGVIHKGDHVSKNHLSSLLAAFCILVASSNAGAQVPPPNHPILFGYAFVDGYYGDFTPRSVSNVWDYTNTYIGIPCGYPDPANPGSNMPDKDCNEHNLIKTSLDHAKANGKKLYLSMNSPQTWDWTIEKARDSWDKVELVEVSAEKGTLNRYETAAQVEAMRHLIEDVKGLPHRPLGARYQMQPDDRRPDDGARSGPPTRSSPTTSNGWA